MKDTGFEKINRSGVKERPGISLRLSRGNILAAVAVLAASAAFFVIDSVLVWEEQPTGSLPIYGFYTAAYVGLTLLAVLLCLVQLRLPYGVRRIAGWVLVLLMPLGAFIAVDLINSTRIFTFPFIRALANYLCYLMVFALCYAISRRAWVTALSGGAVFLIFGIANYFVVQFRGQPILPWDIQSFSTAMEVSGGYEFSPTRQMALAALGFICVLVLSVKIGPNSKDKPSRAARLGERLCALGIFLALFSLVFPANLLSHMSVSVWPWNQKTSSEITGITAGFFANIQFMLVDKPQDYSPERVEEIAQATEEPDDMLGSPDKLPVIVAIMNESLTDLQAVGDVEFTPDNLPYIHSLQASGDVLWGTAYSSVYGGNTCNSEYEFLTGNTTAFLPGGSKPYQQYIDSPQSSLPAVLASYGYRSVAIHPGNRSAWQRDEAYPYLGFDEFVAAADFDVPRLLEHGLTSDLSSYDQVIYEYENREEDEPLFIFNVTIQNHGGFDDEDYPTTVQVKGAEGVFPETEQYLSLTKKSDEALESLLTYFSKQEDPVVVLFFGDHWPNLEQGFLSMLLGANASSLSFEDMMREYEVPFLLWANYPIEGGEISQISFNYLSGLLLRAAGLEATPYLNFLEQLRARLPVITAVGTIDNTGAIYKNGAETPYDDLLNEYAVLQYNNAFDAENKVESVFAVN